jgi:hypothetical protein
MGAQSVLCFAARHREDPIARCAAVAALQGPHDLSDTYARESAPLRAWMERLFGGAPFVDQRPYRRSSVVRLDSQRLFAAAEPSYALHLLDLPLLLVHAPDDPLLYLRAQNVALGTFLRARGAPVVEWSVRGHVPPHDWRIAPARSVCDWLGLHVAGEPPRVCELVSDGEVARVGVRLTPREGAAFATALVAHDGARWELTRLRAARAVEIDVAALGEPPAPRFEFSLRRGSASLEELQVLGLTQRPEAVRRGSRAVREFRWSAEEGLRLAVPDGPARWTVDLPRWP